MVPLLGGVILGESFLTSFYGNGAMKFDGLSDILTIHWTTAFFANRREVIRDCL
jgi:hypothetical protein